MYPSGIPRVASRGHDRPEEGQSEQRGTEHRCRRHDGVVEPGARRQEEQPVRRDDCDERERGSVLRRPALRACVGECAPEAGYELGGRCGQQASWSGRTGFRARCAYCCRSAKAQESWTRSVECVVMAGSRILVVDDDDDIRGLLRTLLERAGHEVSDASDGREGLRELYAGSPDLVILDVAMPSLDGWADARADPGGVGRPRPDADRTRRGARTRPRPQGRSGRLRGQAVRTPGARGTSRRAPAPSTQRRSAGHVRRRPAQHLLRAARRALRRPRRGPDASRIPAAFGVRPAPETGAEPRTAARARLGRHHRNLPRRGQALRRISTAKACPGRPREYPDRDRPRLRLPLQTPV